MTKERRLGRGLEALLGRGPEDFDERPPPAPASRQPPARRRTRMQVSVYEIDRNPFQPRHDFDEAEIDSLAESIRQHGLMQPIVVRRDWRALPTGRRRTPLAGGDQGRLAASAGADPRRRRPPGGRDGHRRKPAAQGSQRARKRRPRSSSTCSVRLHAGRAGRPVEDRPLDGRQPDPPAGTARRTCKQCAAQRHDHARATPGRCCRWATSASRSSSASGFSKRAERAGDRGAGAASRSTHADHEPLGRAGHEDADAPRASAAAARASTAALEQQFRAALGTRSTSRRTPAAAARS